MRSNQHMEEGKSICRFHFEEEKMEAKGNFVRQAKVERENHNEDIELSVPTFSLGGILARNTLAQ